LHTVPLRRRWTESCRCHSDEVSVSPSSLSSRSASGSISYETASSASSRVISLSTRASTSSREGFPLNERMMAAERLHGSLMSLTGHPILSPPIPVSVARKPPLSCTACEAAAPIRLGRRSQHLRLPHDEESPVGLAGVSRVVRVGTMGEVISLRARSPRGGSAPKIAGGSRRLALLIRSCGGWALATKRGEGSTGDTRYEEQRDQ
jgi:hypothetical protein